MSTARRSPSTSPWEVTYACDTSDSCLRREGFATRPRPYLAWSGGFFAPLGGIDDRDRGTIYISTLHR